MINTTYDPIMGAQCTTTEGFPGKVIKITYGKQSTNPTTPTTPVQPKQKKRSKKCEQANTSTTTSRPTVTPKKQKKKRETFSCSVKYETSKKPTKDPRAARYARRRTLALKRKRQDKQALQEFAFMPIAPDKPDNSEAFLQKTIKTSSNISYIMEIILKSPVGTFDKTMLPQLREIISGLQYIHKSIDLLPEVTKKEKNRTLNFVGKALNIVKKTRKKLTEQKTR